MSFWSRLFGRETPRKPQRIDYLNAIPIGRDPRGLVPSGTLCYRA